MLYLDSVYNVPNNKIEWCDGCILRSAVNCNGWKMLKRVNTNNDDGMDHLIDQIQAMK